MFRLTFSLYIRLWCVNFNITPLAWNFLPLRIGHWSDVDLDTLMEKNISYWWLCFGVNIQKRMDIAKILLGKKQEI